MNFPSGKPFCPSECESDEVAFQDVRRPLVWSTVCVRRVGNTDGVCKVSLPDGYFASRLIHANLSTVSWVLTKLPHGVFWEHSGTPSSLSQKQLPTARKSGRRTCWDRDNLPRQSFPRTSRSFWERLLLFSSLRCCSSLAKISQHG